MHAVGNVNQSILFNAVRSIFPNYEVELNTRKLSSVQNPITGKYLEVDVWVRALSISFEFQDPYHYTSTWESHEPLELVQQKDYGLKEKGETLIIVPYWWSGSYSCLQDTISFYRPDLQFQEKKKYFPITLNPRTEHLVGIIPHVGELMLASFPTSSKFDETISPSNPWWVGEKYDGIRFCWNPKTRKIYTRSGTAVDIPNSFIESYPALSFLDGELWFGRGGFQDSQRLVLSIANITTWANLREKKSIAARLLITKFNKLANSVEKIIKDGGEGVILRRPASLYERGRSTHLLKFKASRRDREALVVHDQGDSLILQLPEGITFQILKDAATKLGPDPPKKGDIVTFTYEKYSRKEAPVNPTLLRVRKDVSWENVVKDFNLLNSSSVKDSLLPLDLSENSKHHLRNSVQNSGQSRKKERKRKELRLIFEKSLRAMNLDPLYPSTWYSLKTSKLNNIMGAVKALYKGSIVNAAIDLFPEINLDKSKFAQLPKRYWQNMENRRKYFEDYAREKGFDPLDPTVWYTVQVGDFMNYKNAKNVLYFQKKQTMQSSGFARTLREVFPEIIFDDTKFPKTPAYFLKDYYNRRKVFETFAIQNKFDPLIASNWYPIPAKTFLESKALLSVLRHYEKSVPRALFHLFPDIHLDLDKFLSFPNKYWADMNNRRKFFENFAEQKRFDPLIPSNWYSVTNRNIVNKGGATLLHFYKNFKDALVDAYPDIGLETGKFPYM